MRKALILWRFKLSQMMEKDKTRRENRNYFSLLLVRFLLYKYVCVCARVVSLSLSLSLSELFSRGRFFFSLCVFARSFVLLRAVLF